MLASHTGQLNQGEETPEPVSLGNVVSRVRYYLAGDESNDKLPMRAINPICCDVCIHTFARIIKASDVGLSQLFIRADVLSFHTCE